VRQPEVELQQPAGAIITRLIQLLSIGRIGSRATVAALKALGSLCVGLGYAPRYLNQRAVTESGGLERLLEISKCDRDHEDDDEMALVRVEASLAVALAQLGIQDIDNDIHFENHILQLQIQKKTVLPTSITNVTENLNNFAYYILHITCLYSLDRWLVIRNKKHRVQTFQEFITASGLNKVRLQNVPAVLSK